MFFFWSFSHSRFCLIYLHYLLRKSFVTILQATRTEKSAFEREADRSKVAEEQWRSHRERNGRKKLISVGVYWSETFPPPLYCEGKHMFRPVCPLFCTNVHTNVSRFPVSDTSVTGAFYKVRDSSAGMCIRVSAFYPFSFRHVPLDPFPLKLLSSHHPCSRIPIAIAMRFNSRFDIAVSRDVCEFHFARSASRRKLG